MSSRLFSIAAFAVLAGFPVAAVAQNITVQQPAIRTIGVGTVVSVPDSGRAFLGGISRAGETRNRFGLFPSGTSTGFFREHGGMSVHARIHDLREMDERLLRQGVNSARVPSGRPLSRNAEHAYQSLIGRDESRTGGRSSTVTRAASPISTDDAQGNGTAAMFYRFGLQAEKRGHHSLAQRHFRIAARSGSNAAQQRLAAPRLTARR